MRMKKTHVRLSSSLPFTVSHDRLVTCMVLVHCWVMRFIGPTYKYPMLCGHVMYSGSCENHVGLIERSHDILHYKLQVRSVSFEKLLRIISRELKVGEVFKILQGDVSSLERTQSDFLEFIKEKLLDGAKPTKENGEQACSLFLQHFRPSIEAILVSSCC